MTGTCDRCGGSDAEPLLHVLARDGDDLSAYYDQKLELCERCRIRAVDLMIQLDDRLQRFILRA